MDESVNEVRRSADDRTRRQVERYRETATQQNGAASVLGRLQSLPTYRPKGTKRTDVPTTNARFNHVVEVLKAIEFEGWGFHARVTTGGFLVTAFASEWFVPAQATDDEIVELMFIACQKMVLDAFRFRGERIFSRAFAPAALPVTIPAKTMKSRLRVVLAKGESEKVAAVIRSYFGISRDQARRIIRGSEKFEVLPFHVFDLNERLGKRRLESAAHLATCPKAK